MADPRGDPLFTCERWCEEGRRVALATVMETKGSAPQPLGSHLVVDADGNFEGAISGGCVEGDVVFAALQVIESGKAQELEFGVSDAKAWQAGLTCGGTIRIRVDPVINDEIAPKE